MEGEFKKLSDFEKNLFLKREIKYLLAKLKKAESGETLREAHVEIGKLKSEIEELKYEFKQEREPELKKRIKGQLHQIEGLRKGMQNLKRGIKRNEFMEFFRDDEKLATLSTNDRMEIFQSILVGSSDVTKKNLDALIDNYSVDNLTVIERKWIADIREEYKKEVHEKLGPNGYKELADWAITDFIALYINKIINPE